MAETAEEAEKCHFHAYGLEIGLEMTLPLSFYERQNAYRLLILFW